MITLQELKVVNYRNIKFQVLKFDGNSKIVGDNRIGKTNTIEALYWLLTDKLLNGSKDIEQIKPLDDTKSVVQVSALFDFDGKTISLGKEYKEEWVKTRGTDDLVFKGHTTNYIYNGIKQGTKKEYDSLIASDFGIKSKDYQGIDIMQLLVNPLYLGRMGDIDDWKNLRAMIIDIVGDVSDADVLASKPILLPIKEDMARVNGRTDQLIKGYRDEIKSITEDIIGCDANIQMLEQTEKPNEDSVVIARKGIEECNDKFRNLKSDGAEEEAISQIDKEIIELKNKIIDIKRADLEIKSTNPNEIARKNLNEEKDRLYNDSDTLIQDRLKAINDVETLITRKNELERKVDECKTTRLNLLDDLHLVKNQLTNPTFEKECPHCHRPYDMDKIEEHIAEVTKTLNEKKDAILLKGRSNNEQMQKYEQEKSELETQITDIKLNISRIEDSVKIIRNKIEDINTQLSNLNSFEESTTNPRISELEEKIKSKENEKSKIRDDANAKEESIRSIIAELQNKKEQYQKVIDDYNYWSRLQEQIELTKTKKFDLNKKLVQTEQKVELVKAFIKAKLEMLDENIKKVFVDVSFQLIEPQINGGYSTVCKPYIKGTHTLWKSGSKSEQVTTGVVICERIKAALGLPNLPYIFDEGGEISSNTFSNKFETNSQLICVQVKDGIITPTVMHI